MAGIPGQPGYRDGRSGLFFYPDGVAVDLNKNVFITDSENHAIRKIDPDGNVSTFAGLAGYEGSSDGRGSEAKFYLPSGIAVDIEGTLYVSDR